MDHNRRSDTPESTARFILGMESQKRGRTSWHTGLYEKQLDRVEGAATTIPIGNLLYVLLHLRFG